MLKVPPVTTRLSAPSIIGIQGRTKVGLLRLSRLKWPEKSDTAISDSLILSLSTLSPSAHTAVSLSPRPNPTAHGCGSVIHPPNSPGAKASVWLVKGAKPNDSCFIHCQFSSSRLDNFSLTFPPRFQPWRSVQRRQWTGP